MDNHASEQKFNDFIEDLSIPQLNDEEQSFLEESIRDDKTKKTNNSFEKHRRQIKRSNCLKRVSILHQLYEARLITVLSLMFQDASLKSTITRENIINNTPDFSVVL